MNEFIWKISLGDNREDIRLLIRRALRKEISEDEFWTQYHYYEQLERKYHDCMELDLDCLDWKELEKRGTLCINDYRVFELTEKYGMTPEEGERRFREFDGSVA